MAATVKTLSKKEFDTFVNNLIHNEKRPVIGVKAKGERFIYGPLESADELRLDHDVTILPPKKYFLPQYELLLKFDLTKSFEVTEPATEKAPIIIGMHPYDIIALEQMDKVYLDTQEDIFYKKRRKETIIIGANIQNVSERSFAASMNTHIVDHGYDLFLTDLGDSIACTIGSKKGDQLLKKYAQTRDADSKDLTKIHKIQEALPKKYKQIVKLEKEDWSSLLVANYQHAIWEENSDKCMECSSCTMVCPTCYCYDVHDEVSLNLKEGQRIRTWDGCMLRDFTKIGSGEVFRDESKERYRHRFFRKGNYLPERYGFVACVGCGRCGIACIADIADPSKVINELIHFSGQDEAGRFFIQQDSPKYPVDTPIHTPRSATITRMQKLTDTETLFEITLDDNKPLDHDPGQFVEVSIFGIGEAPICISSPPTSTPSFEIVVRRVGNVTSKLFTMNPGDKLGIRGPLGHGFEAKSLEKKNLLFVSGGIGMFPIRPLINYVLDPVNRKNYGNVTILYGCKRPCDVLFSDEVKRWEKVENVVCKLTVDKCAENECWAGEVGLITTLFPKVNLDKADSKNTIAVVCGPPIMFKFVIKCLQTMGIPDENILVSLERRMKCGVGKCGHCQINGIYCCKEGPVFTYKEIKHLPEAFE